MRVTSPVPEVIQQLLTSSSSFAYHLYLPLYLSFKVRKISTLTGIPSPNRPASSEWLYWLSNRSRRLIYSVIRVSLTTSKSSIDITKSINFPPFVFTRLHHAVMARSCCNRTRCDSRNCAAGWLYRRFTVSDAVLVVDQKMGRMRLANRDWGGVLE